MGRGRRAWLSVQQSPFEFVVALIGAAVALGNLIGRWGTMGLWPHLFYVALLVGGVAVVVGCLCDNLDIESTGIALMLGGYAHSTLRRFSSADNVVDRNLAILQGSALVIGLLIRLWVVRKAVRARREATRARKVVPRG